MHHRSLTRRTRFGIAVAVSAALAATVATGASASAPPSAGGTLVVGMTSDPDTLFPWKATQFQAVNVLGIVYGTLTEFDEELNVVPGLAESWEVSEDGLTVTLHLRTGVTYTDGSTFGSEDVVSSLEQIQLDEKPPPWPPRRSPRSPASRHPMSRPWCSHCPRRTPPSPRTSPR